MPPVPHSLCAVPFWLTQRADRLRTLTQPEDVHPDDFARLQAHVKHARESGLPTWETLQLRRRRKDGTWAEVEASGSCEYVPAARLGVFLASALLHVAAADAVLPQPRMLLRHHARRERTARCQGGTQGSAAQHLI